MDTKCPECDFMRYTPLHDEDFAPNMASRPPSAARFNDPKMKSEGDTSISTSLWPTINQNGEEQQGGLVDNMGWCPNPDCDNIKLVPSISIKAKLPPSCFEKGGLPWQARGPRSGRGSEAAWTRGGGRRRSRSYGLY